MPYRLPDGVHWCVCSDRAIFLDIRADRYFCIPTGPSQTLRRLAAAETAAGDDRHIRWLLNKGILIASTANEIRAHTSVESAGSDYPIGEACRRKPLYVASAILAEIRFARALRRASLADVLDKCGGRKSATNAERRDLANRVSNIVAAFGIVSLLFRETDRCLVRALALFSVCRKQGIYPKLVFGVRLHPFGAHCWVQLGTRILVGNFEQTRLYTPILVVE